MGNFAWFDIQIYFATAGQIALITLRLVHVVVAASFVLFHRAKLWHGWVRTRVFKNRAAFSLSPEIILSKWKVHIVPPRIFCQRQWHHRESRIHRIIRHHRLISENQFFKMSAYSSVSIVFQGCLALIVKCRMSHSKNQIKAASPPSIVGQL